MTTHTALTALGTKSDEYTANAADLTMQAADQVDGEEVTHVGNLLIVAHNTGASPHTITVTSVADDQGRTGDISYSLGAGEYAVFGPFAIKGWRATADAMLDFEADDAEVYFGVVKVPG